MQVSVNCFGQRAIEQAHVPQELAFRTIIEKQQQNQAQSAERAKIEKQHNDLLFKQRRHEEVLQLKTLKTVARTCSHVSRGTRHALQGARCRCRAA